LEIVELLIKAGAKINAIDKGFPIDCPGGNTALILAIQKGHAHIANRLLDAGASPKTKGGGTSVITAAAYLGDAGLVKRLVELGADPKQRDGSRFTPIASAALARNESVIKVLLDLGISPNSPTPGGAPILVDVVGSGNVGLCKVLVNRGANPDLGDSDGFTPLMMACRAAQKDAVEFLLSVGVKVNAQDNRNRTALDVLQDMQKPPDLAPEVRQRLIELDESVGIKPPPPEELNAIAALLKNAGAKTNTELKPVPKS